MVLPISLSISKNAVAFSTAISFHLFSTLLQENRKRERERERGGCDRQVKTRTRVSRVIAMQQTIVRRNKFPSPLPLSYTSLLVCSLPSEDDLLTPPRDPHAGCRKVEAFFLRPSVVSALICVLPPLLRSRAPVIVACSSPLASLVSRSFP